MYDIQADERLPRKRFLQGDPPICNSDNDNKENKMRNTIIKITNQRALNCL